MIKTDWSKYFDKTDKWKIRQNFSTTNEIDLCITEMQRFMHKALKDSSIRHFCKTHNLSTDPDTLADINKLIKLRKNFRKKFPNTQVSIDIDHLEIHLTII